MIISTVKKLDGTKLDHGNFESEEAAREWFQPFIDKGVYGKKHAPARYETHQIETSPAVLDESGNEVKPAEFEAREVLVQEEIMAEFSIEFSPYDSSEEAAAKVRAKQVAEIQAKLTALDKSKVKTFEDLKKVVDDVVDLLKE